MHSALVIAEKILIDRLMSNTAPLTGESKLKFILVCFSGIMALMAVCFLLYGTYLWLDANYTPTAVMFGMAGVTFVLSILSINLICGISKYKRRKIKETRDEMMAMAEDVIKIANHELSQPIKENPLTSTLITAFVGFIAGEKFL